MFKTCEKCPIDSIIEFEGQLVCREYGLVHNERMIEEEYETYEGEENQIKRVGPPEKPEQAREPGTTLIIREKGTKKIIKHFKKEQKSKEIIFESKNIWNLMEYAKI